MTDAVLLRIAGDGSRPTDETCHMPILVEVSDWAEGGSVVSADAGPGAVRGAVEATLRKLGMTATER
jgi:hypothetical protein